MPDPSPGPTGDAPTLRVLIVDDDPLSTSAQAHLASLLGFAPQVAHDAGSALAIAATGAVDVVLVDLDMPGIDGFETLRRLRDLERTQSRPPLPAIAVTGYTSEADRRRCLDAGFASHLPKPVRATAMEQALRAAAQRSAEAGTTCDAERLRAAVRRLATVKPSDTRFAPTVTESFALRSAQLIDGLRRALGARAIEEGCRAASALASGAEYIGALRLAGMGRDAERAIEAGDWVQLERLLPVIDNEHQAVLAVLFEATR